jgi:hypothetical protein
LKLDCWIPPFLAVISPLRPRRFRINDEPRIQHYFNTRDADLAVITHPHFGDRGHIRQEPATGSEPKPAAFCAPVSGPAGFVDDDFDDLPQATGFPRDTFCNPHRNS